MKLGAALRGGASRFAHLTAIKPKVAAPKKPDGEKKPADEEKEKNAAAAPAESENEATAVVIDEDEEDAGSEELDDSDLEDELESTKKAKAAGHGAALKVAARAERARCAAIFASKHAQGRIPMACELAFDPDTTISAEHATRILAASPQEQTASTFVREMAAQPKHDIGEDKPGGQKAETADQRLIAHAQERAKSLAAKRA